MNKHRERRDQNRQNKKACKAATWRAGGGDQHCCTHYAEQKLEQRSPALGTALHWAAETG